MIKRAASLGLLTQIFVVMPVHAQISEVRFGLAEFAEDTINAGLEVDNGVENSTLIVGEIILEEPEFLKWALSPQPYVQASINLSGDTSYGGAGLLWRQNLGKRFYVDLGLGLVIHDGTTEIDISEIPQTSFFAALAERRNSEREFGSRILFREQLTLGYKLSDSWSTEVYFEHISNAGLLGSDDETGVPLLQSVNQNDAADIIGLRVAKRF